ncbi:uncharacterized protein WM277_018220 isoform 2-T7 [Molossus nigricans]
MTFGEGSFHVTQTVAATSCCFRSGSEVKLGPFREAEPTACEVPKSPDHPHSRMRTPTTQEMTCPSLANKYRGETHSLASVAQCCFCSVSSGNCLH